MDIYIFVILTIILLLLILFRLPIGMNTKRKIIFLIVSFLIAQVALAIINFYSIWLSLITILILGLVATFLIEKFFKKSLSVNKNQSENQPDLGLTKINEDNNKEFEEIHKNETSNDNNYFENTNYELETRIEEVHNELLNDVRNNEIIESDKENVSTIAIEESQEIQAPVLTEEKIAPNEDFLQNEKDCDVSGEITLHEIIHTESIIEKDDNILNFEENVKDEANVLEEEINKIIELAEKEAVIAKETDFENVLIDMTDTVEAIEDIFINEDVERIAEKSNLTDENNVFEVDEHIENSVTKVNPPKQAIKSKLQTQLFHSMVCEIHIKRQIMSPDEYEAFVKAHIKPELPDQDYYTFVHLLIEHYILEGKGEELSKLLNGIRKRFENYSTIRQEIVFLLQKYE